MKDWDKIVRQMAKAMHSGSLQKGSLSVPMVRTTADYLTEAMHRGLGTDSLKYVNKRQVEILKTNILWFSGFKNLQQMKETTSLLVGKDGQVRSFADFYKDVKKVDNTYNKAYLAAEYNYATTTSESIALWNRVQDEKDTLPSLRWSAVHDERTRPDHMILDGICLPVDHPFWLTHWIPYAWNCRCLIHQEGHSAHHTPHRIKDLPEPPPFFDRNPGVDGEIFPVDKKRYPKAQLHPYAKNATTADISTVADTVKTILGASNITEGEQMGQWITVKGTRYQAVYTSESGNIVAVHPMADTKDLAQNIEYGKIFADSGDKYKVLIREHVIGEGVKNPEVIINGKVGDFKTPIKDTERSFRSQIERASKQKCDFVAIMLKGRDYSKELIAGALNRALNGDSNKSIQFLYLVYGDGTIIKITRESIRNGEYLNIIRAT